MSLRTKIFLLSGGSVGLLVVLSLFAVQRRLQTSALTGAGIDMALAAQAADALAADRQAAEQAEADLLAGDPALAAAFAARDAAGLERALARIDRDRATTADLLLAVDGDGALLASVGASLGASQGTGQGTGQGDVAAPPSAGLGRFEPVRSALTGRGRVARRWLLGGRLFDVVAAPARLGEARREPTGALVLATEVDSTTVHRLADSTRCALVLVAGDRVVGSSLPPGLADALVESYRRLAAGEPQPLLLGGQSYLPRVDVAPLAYGQGTAVRVLLLPLARPARLMQALRRDWLVLGVLALILAAGVAWLATREITRPLTRLADRMHEMARTGRLDTGIGGGRGGGREIALFEATFVQMVRSLEQSQRDRESSYVDAIGAVVALSDARDHETAGHSFRVAHYAIALARAMCVPEEELRAIEWGALLHDVGKIAVPDAILRKADCLTEEEWMIMRQHPTWGCEMLSEVQFLKPALDIVYNHHERWDGSGYPRGLAADAIPLAARIFAVVDTYDSITSDRPYRRGQGHQVAVAELRRAAGAQLDPTVVDAFLHIPEVQIRRLRELSAAVGLGVSLPYDVDEIRYRTESG